MRIPPLVLRKMKIELRTKTDKQLDSMYNLYNSQLNRLSDKDYEYYSKPLKQKMELVKQEMHLRSVLNSQQISK